MMNLLFGFLRVIDEVLFELIEDDFIDKVMFDALFEGHPLLFIVLLQHFPIPLEIYGESALWSDQQASRREENF